MSDAGVVQSTLPESTVTRPVEERASELSENLDELSAENPTVLVWDGGPALIVTRIEGERVHFNAGWRSYRSAEPDAIEGLLLVREPRVATLDEVTEDYPEIAYSLEVLRP